MRAAFVIDAGLYGNAIMLRAVGPRGLGLTAGVGAGGAVLIQFFARQTAREWVRMLMSMVTRQESVVPLPRGAMDRSHYLADDDRLITSYMVRCVHMLVAISSPQNHSRMQQH